MINFNSPLPFLYIGLISPFRTIVHPQLTRLNLISLQFSQHIAKHLIFSCNTILFNWSEWIVFRHGFRSPSPLTIPPKWIFHIFSSNTVKYWLKFKKKLHFVERYGISRIVLFLYYWSCDAILDFWRGEQKWLALIWCSRIRVLHNNPFRLPDFNRLNIKKASVRYALNVLRHNFFLFWVERYESANWHICYIRAWSENWYFSLKKRQYARLFLSK